ncbi:hypothetical protein [Heyndrickxia sporothermodurans]|uniref:hypothetical protein n=1 Tax=Heyndrickxia sporothermodurans TaxID=46224 RepID=UPI000D36C1D3|nr:hypothetical protein [Heyndrickxia sporothermodurans]PTY75762.1 hypothetical protein B5V89_19750 [Heyndrickxia sporothermodurans]
MYTVIEIHYIVAGINNRTLQKGQFPLKGRSKEQVAYEFWREIKKQTSLDVEIEKIICENIDITEQVKTLEKRNINKVTNDNLPF